MANAILVGYDENGIPIFETVYEIEPLYMGVIYDEEGRAIPIYV